MISESKSRPRGMRVLFGLYFMLSNFYRLDCHNKICIASSKSYNATSTDIAFENRICFDLVMVIERACLLIDF
jgi:hypothetical protein